MSDLEATFDTRWRQLGGGLPLTAEHRFAKPRRWRFDRAHLGAMVAVELEGGVYANGRHTRGKGFEDDCEKINTAQSLGWAVFRLTAGMLSREPVRWLSMIREAIRAREPVADPTG